MLVGVAGAMALDFVRPKKRAFSFYAKHGWTVSETKADIVYMKKKL